MTDKAKAREAIRSHVWAGFDEPEEIVEMLTESLDGLEAGDEGWLRAEIDKELARKQAEEETWPDVTDCDRLDEVLDGFWEQGILAIQNAGYTQSDGIDDVTQFYHEAGGEKSDFVGYCFYHGQDLERVMVSGDLWLTYGAIDGDDARGVVIGQRIQKALEEAGFTVEWDGTIGTRLLIRGIRWQRRSGS